MPGSEFAVCRSSVPWLRITHRGSDCVVPLGSNKTTWNFLKSVELISLFIGQVSNASGMVSLSKSSKHASPLPSAARGRNKERECQRVISVFSMMGKKKEIMWEMVFNVWLVNLQRGNNSPKGSSTDHQSPAGPCWEPVCSCPGHQVYHRRRHRGRRRPPSRLCHGLPGCCWRCRDSCPGSFGGRPHRCRCCCRTCPPPGHCRSRAVNADVLRA